MKRNRHRLSAPPSIVRSVVLLGPMLLVIVHIVFRLLFCTDIVPVIFSESPTLLFFPLRIGIMQILVGLCLLCLVQSAFTSTLGRILSVAYIATITTYLMFINIRLIVILK